MGAAYHRGSSKQDYRTPLEFVRAVQWRYGQLDFDLAAHRDNALTTNHMGPGSYYAEDTLKVEDLNKLLGGCNITNYWLNPPFGDIQPWAEWCQKQGTLLRPYQRILLLVPASVGANWYKDHVHYNANVVFLNGRLSFDGQHPFPKDCMLCEYTSNWRYRVQPEVWDWKSDVGPAEPERVILQSASGI